MYYSQESFRVADCNRVIVDAFYLGVPIIDGPSISKLKSPFVSHKDFIHGPVV